MPASQALNRDPFWDNAAMSIFTALIDLHEATAGVSGSITTIVTELSIFSEARPVNSLPLLDEEIQILGLHDPQFREIVDHYSIHAHDLAAAFARHQRCGFGQGYYDLSRSTL